MFMASFSVSAASWLEDVVVFDDVSVAEVREAGDRSTRSSPRGLSCPE